MKKERIAEMLYVIVAVLFLGICIGTGQATSETGQAEKTESGVPVDAVTPVPTPVLLQTQQENKNPGVDLNGEDTPSPITGAEPTKQPEVDEELPTHIEIKNENYEQYENVLNAWWFKRKEDHSPSGSGETFSIAPYSAYYLDTNAREEDKVVYLTFDCGYENGYTPTILKTLAEENVKATFFVTKDFVVKNPEYVKQMKEQGHFVGNHTVRHLSSPSLTPEELEAELNEVADTMLELTGYEMDPFFRPPMGEYSERTLKVAQDMGYSSIFWSIAYYDYNVNDQPGKEYVVDHFNTYHHNGTIILMHNTSQSNAEALGDVVDLLKAEGYRFGMLREIVEN